MEKWSLREICNRVQISRRTIQGYEKAGLLTALERDERGYLVYGEQEENRIRKIKLFQQLGFTRKEIKEIIDAPKDVLRNAIENQIMIMKDRKGEISEIIDRAHRLIDEMVD